MYRWSGPSLANPADPVLRHLPRPGAVPPLSGDAVGTPRATPPARDGLASVTGPEPPGAEDTREIRRSQAPAPGPTDDSAVVAAHSLAASHARRSAQALDAVFRLAGITDEHTREHAHEAFLRAFPISYRLCRDRLNQPPEWPPTRQG